MHATFLVPEIARRSRRSTVLVWLALTALLASTLIALAPQQASASTPPPSGVKGNCTLKSGVGHQTWKSDGKLPYLESEIVTAISCKNLSGYQKDGFESPVGVSLIKWNRNNSKTVDCWPDPVNSMGEKACDLHLLSRRPTKNQVVTVKDVVKVKSYTEGCRYHNEYYSGSLYSPKPAQKGSVSQQIITPNGMASKPKIGGHLMKTRYCHVNKTTTPPKDNASVQFRKTRVTNIFKNLLGRSPEASALNHFTGPKYPCTVNGQSHMALALINVSIANKELEKVIGYGKNRDWKRDGVNRVYRALLGRSPDASGFKFWMAKVGKVDDLNHMAKSIVTDLAEYRNVTIKGCGVVQDGPIAFYGGNTPSPWLSAVSTQPSAPVASNNNSSNNNSSNNTASNNTASNNSDAFIMKQGNGAHWWITNGTREWISPACASGLAKQGIKTQNANWTQISKHAKRDVLGCPKATGGSTNSAPATSGSNNSPSNNSASNNSGAFIMKQGNGAHWWITNGTREWISPACASGLAKQGIKTQNANWTQISKHAKRDVLGCPKA